MKIPALSQSKEHVHHMTLTALVNDINTALVNDIKRGLESEFTLRSCVGFKMDSVNKCVDTSSTTDQDQLVNKSNSVQVSLQ